MKHRLVVFWGSLVAVAAVAALSLAAVGIAGTSAAAKSSAVKPPPVPNAMAIKAKYGGQTITFIGDSVGLGHQRDMKLATQFTKSTGIKVKVVPHSTSSTASYAQLARNFSSHSSSIDVMMLDVIWPGAFAPYLLDLKPELGKQAKLHAKGIVQNDTVNGKLVAMPWFGDYGILYYRTDLLKKYGYKSPPTTWAQLTTMAKKIQAGEQASNPNFYGFVFQGNAYEGLTCDALEWIASSGGGHFIDNGKVTINNAKAAKALDLAASWVGTIAPRGVTSYQETEAHTAFVNGDAAFMRNWPYAYSVASDKKSSKIVGKFGVTVLPHGPGGTSVGTVGGWQLGISKYSKHPGAATEFVRYMTSPAVEKFDALFSTSPPTIPSVARDKQVQKVNPWLNPKIANVDRVTRPSSALGTKYQQGSQIIYQGINRILNGTPAKSVLPGMQSQLQRLLKK